ncbi:hypothetical protein [Streptomyces anulatus]|uniref:Uncharacterized protein n=1 Tax=Streptomyces anulatus TaxID=1892 RepID=A0A7K3RB87_STRAQ|nr:hypothetical protein [Streptomyces anulatus]NEB99271.1 hypothetical protein [Streptomyces anulatus]NED24460.1 hypothetical protein [Streptomyces anulatus]
MPPEKQGAEAPDPAETAMAALLQDLMDLQDRLVNLEIQERRSRAEARGPVRPGPPGQGQEQRQEQEQEQEAAAPGRRAASASTDTAELIAHLIRKLLERLTLAGQHAAQQQATSQRQPWTRQSPAPAPDRNDQLSRSGHQERERSVAEAVERILGDHPELVEMFHDGRLPRTKQLFDEAHRATSAQAAISQAAALDLPAPAEHSALVDGTAGETEELEEDLPWLEVDHGNETTRERDVTDESAEDIEDEVFHDALDDLDAPTETEVFHDALDDLDAPTETEVFHDALDDLDVPADDGTDRSRTSVSSMAALNSPGFTPGSLSNTPVGAAAPVLPVVSEQVAGRGR